MGSQTDDGGAVEIVLVAAVAENGVIGRDGGLPWHFPEDLKHFKETTIGHPVIMGRRTFEGIVDRLGEPLPGRTNVVLSSGAVPRADAVVDSIDAAIEHASMDAETVYVIGGATIYEQFLPQADRMVLTEVHDSYEGDARFPQVDWTTWAEVERDAREAFDFVEYVRRDR